MIRVLGYIGQVYNYTVGGAFLSGVLLSFFFTYFYVIMRQLLIYYEVVIFKF